MRDDSMTINGSSRPYNAKRCKGETMIRVYRFGLLRPTANETLIRDQMHKAHVYRNVLVELERQRRFKTRAAMSAYGDIPELERAAKAAQESERALAIAIKSARAKARKLKTSPESKEALAAAKEARKAAMTALSLRRAELKTDEKLALIIDAINDESLAKQKQYRESCGVYWGTYLLIEDAMQASRKQPLYDGTEPSDPHFVRWQGEGRVGIQLQGGIPTATLFSGNTIIRIEKPDERAWWSESRSERRRLSRTTLRMRIGSDDRAPVWAEWPMVMHREIPEFAVIKKATVSLRKKGPIEEWAVEITVDEGDSVAARHGEGEVGIDIGWRVIDSEIRVAAWEGSDGQTGELRVPPELLSSLHKAEELRSIRDKSFNEIRDQLSSWMQYREMPEWFSEQTKTIAMWRSPARLAKLVRMWRDNRFADDDSAYEIAEKWRYHDFHLWEWECCQRTKSLRRRREFYRIFSAELASKYETVVLEKFDIRPIARKRSVENDENENETARSNRQLMSVSEMRLCIVNAFRARKGKDVYVPAQNTTRECNVCHVIEIFDAANELRHTCENGHEWDQDFNARINILDRWTSERPGGAPVPAPARNDEKVSKTNEVKESRWVRARRLKDAKAARKIIAREVQNNLAE